MRAALPPHLVQGTAYMNAWMYVVREYEDAIDDCNAGCIGGLTNADCNQWSAKAVHAWDEGVAFYTGSLEGTDGAGSGVMPYALADKRCANFRTCLDEDGASGTATVNDNLFDEFGIGIDLLNRGKCAEVPEVVRKIVAQMSVPLIQVLLASLPPASCRPLSWSPAAQPFCDAHNQPLLCDAAAELCCAAHAVSGHAAVRV